MRDQIVALLQGQLTKEEARRVLLDIMPPQVLTQDKNRELFLDVYANVFTLQNYDIKFKVNSRHLRDSAVFLERIARIVVGPEGMPDSFVRRETGCQYQIDRGNNWFVDLNDTEVTVSYRYGHAGIAPAMNGLRDFLTWIFS